MNQLALSAATWMRLRHKVLVVTHEINKQTGPPLSETESSRIKSVHDGTKVKANVHLKGLLKRLL